MTKVFNLNLVFKWLGLVYGDYDGESFRSSGIQYALLRIWSAYWLTNSVFQSCRHTALALLPRDPGIGYEFWLCDFVSAIKGRPYRLMILIGPLYCSLYLYF